MNKPRVVHALGIIVLLLAGSVPGSAQDKPNLTEQYGPVAGRIIGAALEDRGGWEKLIYLTTQIGNRISGSPQLERAVAWAEKAMRADGLENVRLQPVKVPRWVRGTEWVKVLSPVEKPLAMLGLGGSVATPKQGIRAPVVVVSSFDELEALGREKVAGKIVLYDVPFTRYGETVKYRGSGAARAEKLGAVAMLLRSVGSSSLYTPHTGSMDTEKSPSKIPAAAITVEDSAWIHRLAESGAAVRVELHMEAHFEPDADSANVIGEIKGREKPEEVVVLGGHIDSWDVGQGAQDDGTGIIAAWEAVKVLQQLGLRPRRTIRVVLWTNEENGLRGGRAYRDALGANVSSHVAAIEMDIGAERPVGFDFALHDVLAEGQPALKPDDSRYAAPRETLEQIGKLLTSLDGGRIRVGGGGADISPLMRAGVPGLGLETVGERYFDWHHTNADTLDKVDPQNLRKCIAHLAVMAYVLADMPGRLVEPSK